jgi:hypothetical protein
MPEQEIKYSNREVRCVRGLEKRTIEKFESDGWEYVSEVKGKVQTTLTFRKPKAKIPAKLIAIAAAGTVALVSIITIGALNEGDKEGSSVPMPTETNSSAKPTEEPSKTSEEIITVDNNADFAKLLVDTSGNTDLYQSFYNKYKGRTISFDGNVAFMAPFKDYKYTYDVLLYAGDYDENTAVGPPFRVEHVVIPVGWQNTNPDDFITVETNLKIVAELYDYNPVGQTFQLHLVSVTVR